VLRWFKVCKADELSAGKARSISLYGRPFAVFNVDGELFGIDGACRHAKANLAYGKLEGEIVECFMHGWRYNVKTGECLTHDYGRVKQHPVKIEADSIWIGVDWPPTDS
jgi:nitrite reductase (NADH) small subunit